MDQIQCPNCGGYDVELTDKPLGLELLMWMGFIFYIIPGLVMIPVVRREYEKRWQLFWEGKTTATCKLCGFEFRASQVPSTPIRPNEQLIQAGRQRLKEEEEKRRKRRLYYDD